VASSSDGSKLVGTVTAGQIYTFSSTVTLTPVSYTSLLGYYGSTLDLMYVGSNQFMISGKNAMY
jgi:hypothetical protein